ncbi:class Ib ribonucleoside-diphosphate reductase assembly flavoprotein NrdI [Leptotrichia sp. oral taxon 218]|jgi:nrdI protein|uniref:class Ib ribonucleoside-diphosphate reductase assembly flavoprotein NrdI n=1 Tax=Leptotrichia sp. oral taxon 218 TaxID=712361 RepID=UPI001B8B7B53|nr:class Ib ribonucleoside-diphosphate reductase assembly flavoprotein NrdI [Leptotrichia sp. oral taxon 218]QUB96193.1 class Ib ribonucleoside-diphosphate reductase assembly flavoprotein NrdI [Leptotrichia sp. oral taxon 218]
MIIYYDSKTGNVQRFMEKIKDERPDWEIIKINPDLEAKEDGHFVTFTTKIGEVPETTAEFLKKNSKYIKSISSSGNMNWGVYFAVAADKIKEEYKIPVCMKFELSGTNREVKHFIDYVEKFNK